MMTANGHSLATRLSVLLIFVALAPLVGLIFGASPLVTGLAGAAALVPALLVLYGTLKPIRMLAHRLRNGQAAGSAAGTVPEVAVIEHAIQTLERRVQDAQRAQNVYLGLYRNLFEASPLAVVLVDAQGQSLDANPAFEALTGYQSDELQKGAWDQVVDPDDRQLARILWRDMLQEVRDTAQTIRIIHKNSERHWADVRVRRVDNEFNGRNYMVILRDISAQKHALDQLHLERRKAIALMDLFSDGLILTDENDFVQYLNGAAQMLLGAGVGVVGQPLALFLKQPLAPVETGADAIGSRQSLVMELTGQPGQCVELSSHPVHDEESRSGCKILVLRPRAVGAPDQPRSAQTHDPLTGLANREAFESFLRACLLKNGSQSTPSVVALVDLDHFRQLNVEEGWETGDEVLRRVAQVLVQNVRQCDLVARFGGDEFGVLLTGCDSSRAAPIIEGIRADLEKMRLDGSHPGCRVTASIGFTELAATDQDIRSLLRRADEGCCRAKVQGRNLVHRVLSQTAAEFESNAAMLRDEVALVEKGGTG